MNPIKRKIGLCLLAGLLMVFFTGYQTVSADTAPGDGSTLEYRTGKIDMIRLDRVVIDDIQYKFTEQTQFLSKSGKPIKANQFYKGDKVEFKATEKNKLLILKKP